VPSGFLPRMIWNRYRKYTGSVPAPGRRDRYSVLARWWKITCPVVPDDRRLQGASGWRRRSVAVGVHLALATALRTLATLLRLTPSSVIGDPPRTPSQAPLRIDRLGLSGRRSLVSSSG
jgi:hypothetical protein